MLFVTPEYNRSIPGALKNAIDWASRPWGDNSFALEPSAVIGASPGKLGTALAQLSLRSVLGYCNSPQMNSPEAYIQFHPDVFTPDGDVLDDSTKRFLTRFMADFATFITRVHSVVPQLGYPICPARGTWVASAGAESPQCPRTPSASSPVRGRVPDSPSPERRRSGQIERCRRTGA
ncbi:NADPH-dependent FMN reductase [Nocardia sp. NPDC004750]